MQANSTPCKQTDLPSWYFAVHAGKSLIVIAEGKTLSAFPYCIAPHHQPQESQFCHYYN
jgi:hypothetical protein